MLFGAEAHGCHRLDVLLLGIDRQHAPAGRARDVGELRDEERRGSGELVGFGDDGEKLG